MDTYLWILIFLYYAALLFWDYYKRKAFRLLKESTIIRSKEAEADFFPSASTTPSTPLKQEISATFFNREHFQLEQDMEALAQDFEQEVEQKVEQAEDISQAPNLTTPTPKEGLLTTLAASIEQPTQNKLDEMIQKTRSPKI